MNSIYFRIAFRKICYTSNGSILRYSTKIRTKDSAVAQYLKRQMTDPFSKLARIHDYRARSAFKLLEMNKKHRIIKKGDVVVDTGAAPGSWCQVASEILFSAKDENNASTSSGYILGVDIQPIVDIENVDLLYPANITKPATHLEMKRRLNGRWVNCVLSDMAPNPTGDAGVDHERIINLCRALFQLISPNEDGILPMAQNGKFLCKIWDGPFRADLANELRTFFKDVRSVKPEASRDNSAELYLYANGYMLT